MKLVNFKRAVDELEGRRIVLLGAASYAESLYPARRVPARSSSCDLLLPAADLDGLAGFLGTVRVQARRVARRELRVLSRRPTRTITLHGGLLGPGFEDEDRGLLDRALPVRSLRPVLLPSRRPKTRCSRPVLEQAHAGYSVPIITFVDLRELLLGAPSMQGAYSRPLDLAQVRARADALAPPAGGVRLDPHRRRACSPRPRRVVESPGAGPAPARRARFSMRWWLRLWPSWAECVKLAERSVSGDC